MEEQNIEAHKSGTVVTLKSGGQRMTIAAHYTMQGYLCLWHTTDGQEKDAYYTHSVLMVAGTE
ncbi:MAG: DUF2158 domain-containing protein [Nitrosomonadaceae bacterium]|nr:DUF2158 domain-containing protein [Nitrosomonadaceae bacterium]